MLFPLSYILAEGDGGWTQIIPLIIILAFSALGGLTEKLKKKKQQDSAASSTRPRPSSSSSTPPRRTTSAPTAADSPRRLKPVNRAPQRPARSASSTMTSTRPVPASPSSRSTLPTRTTAAPPTPPARPAQRRPQPKPAPRPAPAHRREIPTTKMAQNHPQQSSAQASKRRTPANAASRVAAQQYLEKTKKKIHQAQANLGSQKNIEVKTVEPATANTSPLARIQQLPLSDLARAIVYSEIIGPPRALQNNTSQIPGLKN